MGRRARQQRIRQRLGLDLAGADRLGRLGHAKIVKLRHGRVLNRRSPRRCDLPAVAAGGLYGRPQGGGIGINVDHLRRAHNSSHGATSCVPSPQGGEGQDEGVLTPSICWEADPPHPTLSPVEIGCF